MCAVLEPVDSGGDTSAAHGFALSMWPENKHGIIQRSYALDVGLTDLDLKTAQRDGEIVCLGSGGYVRTERLPEYDVDVELYRLASIAAADRQSLALSHESAAALHGLALLKPDHSVVHFARPGTSGGRQSAKRHIHVGLSDDDVVRVDGFAVSSLAKTAVDVAAKSDFARALAVLDSALRAGVALEELEETAERQRIRGIATVRSVLRYANGLAANPGESWSRAQMINARLPVAVLQRRYVLFDGSNAFPDFDWDGKVLGEFDGLRKYGRDLKPGQSVEDALEREKLREIALRDLVDEIVRWIWDDLENNRMVPRVARALVRAGLMG